ncbi:hypothetical protein V3C99_018724 [Haemonchus contortus]
MWINPSFNHLRCLRTNLKLRRRGVRTVLYGSGEALQRRPHFLQGHRRGPRICDGHGSILVDSSIVK